MMKLWLLAIAWIIAAVLVTASFGIASLPDPGLRWFAGLVDVCILFFMSVAMPSLLMWWYSQQPPAPELRDRLATYAAAMRLLTMSSFATMSLLWAIVTLSQQSHAFLRPGKHVFFVP